MNESSILFSVVIPVYNSEDYIEQLLRHFVTQNNNRFEVIVVDDGSKDNSLSICQKVSEQNDFIVVLSQRNQVLAQPVIMDFGMCGESMSFSLIVMIPLPMITCLH